MFHCPATKRGQRAFMREIEERRDARRIELAAIESQREFERQQLALRVLEMAREEAAQIRQERERVRQHKEMVRRQDLIKRQLELAAAEDD